MGITVTYGSVTKHYAKGLTNRRCLLIFGAVLAGVGIAGFFVNSNPGDHYHLGTGQSVAYLIMGLAALFVGEVWSSEWKRAFLGVQGMFFLGVGIAGFVQSALIEHQLGIDLGVFHVQNPWENVTHLLLGVIFIATVLYPRRFRDYSFASNVSD